MSNLTADLNLDATQWSVQTIAALKQFEQTCADEQLFDVGYLIPLVERLELECEAEHSTAEQWHQSYLAYVMQCMSEDKMSDKDREGVLMVCQQALG